MQSFYSLFNYCTGEFLATAIAILTLSFHSGAQRSLLGLCLDTRLPELILRHPRHITRSQRFTRHSASSIFVCTAVAAQRPRFVCVRACARVCMSLYCGCARKCARPCPDVSSHLCSVLVFALKAAASSHGFQHVMGAFASYSLPTAVASLRT